MRLSNILKKTILILLFASVFSCLYAEMGYIQWRYKLKKYVEESISISFTDLHGNQITTYGVDCSKDLGMPQIQLEVNTNKTTDYNLKLTFSAMKHSDGGDVSFFGYYKARITDIIRLSQSDLDYRDVEFTSPSDVSVTFPGDCSNNANNILSFYYPIAFDFSDYLEDYGAGSFGGTIRAEVATL